MSQPDTFVIVDGNSLMHRAFHALPPLSNEDGVFTNAVFGFLSMLFKVIGDEQPRYLAVAFDLHGPTFRHTDYSEYKAGRKPTAPELKPQFDLVRECLTKMGVKILTCPTFEADDILGTFARRCEEAGIPALLVTGDRDSMQLVTETSSVLYTRRGVSDVVRYTPEKVLEDFGVTPAQIPDLKGLMGDASDNIPGVGVKVRFGGHGQDRTGLDVHHNGAAAVLNGVGRHGLVQVALHHLLNVHIQREHQIGAVLGGVGSGVFIGNGVAVGVAQGDGAAIHTGQRGLIGVFQTVHALTIRIAEAQHGSGKAAVGVIPLEALGGRHQIGRAHV